LQIFRLHGLRQVVNLSFTGAIFSAALAAITVTSLLVTSVQAMSIQWTCTVLQCVAIAALTSQLYGHAITLIDRYVALAYPVRYPHVMTRQRIIVTAVLTWIYVMAVSSIPLVIDSDDAHDSYLENGRGSSTVSLAPEHINSFLTQQINEEPFGEDFISSNTLHQPAFLKSSDVIRNPWDNWMLPCHRPGKGQLLTLFRGKFLIFLAANLIAGILLSSALAVSVVAELVSLRHHRITLHQHRLQRPMLEERRHNDVVVSRAILLTYFSCLFFWAPFVIIVFLRFDPVTMRRFVTYQAFAEETLLLLGLSIPVISVIVHFMMLGKLKFKWVVRSGKWKKDPEELQDSSSPETGRYFRRTNVSVQVSKMKTKYGEKMTNTTSAGVEVPGQLDMNKIRRKRHMLRQNVANFLAQENK